MTAQHSNPRLPAQASPPPELVAPGSNGLPVRARAGRLSIVAASRTDAWMDAATVQPTIRLRGIAYGLVFSAPFRVVVYALVRGWA